MCCFLLIWLYWPKILWQCACAIENLAAYYFTNITMGEAPQSSAAINLARHIAECPALLPEVSVGFFSCSFTLLILELFHLGSEFLLHALL